MGMTRLILGGLFNRRKQRDLFCKQKSIHCLYSFCRLRIFTVGVTSETFGEPKVKYLEFVSRFDIKVTLRKIWISKLARMEHQDYISTRYYYAPLTFVPYVPAVRDVLAPLNTSNFLKRRCEREAGLEDQHSQS